MRKTAIALCCAFLCACGPTSEQDTTVVRCQQRNATEAEAWQQVDTCIGQRHAYHECQNDRVGSSTAFGLLGCGLATLIFPGSALVCLGGAAVAGGGNAALTSCGDAPICSTDYNAVVRRLLQERDLTDVSCPP